MKVWQNVGKRSGGVAGFLGVVFFLFLADAILSDWAPGFVQGVVGSSFKMGLIISFSSVVGLAMDLIFAKVLEGSRVKKLIWWSILGCMIFALSWQAVIIKPWVWLMLVAMASWGFYYDLFGFFSQQYVAETTTKELRPAMWGLVGVVRNLAYFLGPIIGTNLLRQGNENVIRATLLVLVVAGLLLSVLKIDKSKVKVEHHKISMRAEIEHWHVLFGRAWPVLSMSLILGLIDATYWTTGTIVSDVLAKQNWWGEMFLPFYVLPSLLVGIVMGNWKIETGKKKLAVKLIIGAGVLMGLLNVSNYLWWRLGVVLVSSSLLAISWPLVNAVYTDLIVRMGREREHLMGLSDSMMNIAYIVGPIMAGMIAAWVGEINSFVILGWLVALMSLVLNLTMPRKIRLPQKEMIKWEDEDDNSTAV